MADLIKFTRNYNDMSTESGYQFKFFCDICGDGYMSPFKENIGNKAQSLLRGLGRLTGGVIDRVGDAAYQMRQHTMGKAWDEQFRWAIDAVKPHFIQCSRCGKWVCREVCWNEKAGLCTECAPKLEQEMAAAQSQAELEQMREKVKAVDFTKDLNVTDRVVAKCPKCGQETAGGKFCPSCGANLSPEKFCTRCGTKIPGGAKFCPGCGNAAE